MMNQRVSRPRIPASTSCLCYCWKVGLIYLSPSTAATLDGLVKATAGCGVLSVHQKELFDVGVDFVRSISCDWHSVLVVRHHSA